MNIRKQFDEILNKKLKETVNSKLNNKLLNKIGAEAKDQIVKRTRLGKGVKNFNGSAFKLLPLKDSTIDQRDRYEFNLSPFTIPQRSNLTATGQLLDSIDYKIINDINKSITLYFKENRRKELSGSRARVKHKDLSRYVAKNGRPFFNLASFEIKKLRSIIFDAFNK